MNWRKRPPDTTGYWLRTTCTGRPQIETVVSGQGRLWVVWGRNEQSAYLPVTHPKIQGWWWMKFSLPQGVDDNLLWDIDAIGTPEA